MSARQNGAGLAGEPRVQLLPPSVRLREKAREARRLVVLLLVLAVVIVGGGVTFGLWRGAQAQSALAEAQARTQEIFAEQAQYSESTRVAALVEISRNAELLVTSNEFDWAAIRADLAAYLPVGATFDRVSVVAPAPWEPALVAEGPLRAARAGIVTITVGSLDYALAAAFVAAVARYDGLADVTITGSVFDAGFYSTTVVITLNPDARAGRFLTDDSNEETTADAGEQSDASGTTNGDGQ